jgi:hypothetical protein
MLRMLRIAAALAATAIAGSAPAEDKIADAALTALKTADKIEVMALDPQGGDESKTAFHEYKVLAKTTVTDADARQAVAEAVANGVTEGGAIAKCFEPRHGLRVACKGTTYDFVICYQCSQIELYTGADDPDVVATSDASRAALDKVLENADAPGK